MYCFVMRFNSMTDCKQDLDIIESHHNFEFKGDDIEYDRNVSDDIEIESDGCQDEVQDEREDDK